MTGLDRDRVDEVAIGWTRSRKGELGLYMTGLDRDMVNKDSIWLD